MNIEDFLSSLADGKSVLVGHPSAIERLKEMGVDVEEAPRLSPDTAIKKLFEQREPAAREVVRALPGIPNAIPAAVALLYEETIQCLLFGLHGAAISMSAILVEFALKFAVFIVETGSETAADFDSERWQALESIPLAEAIERAAGVGLIGDRHRKKLKSFKDRVRNPYLHYNIQKISRPYRWENVQLYDLETGEVEIHDGVVADDPVLQAQAKPVIDEHQSVKVLEFADKVVNHVFAEAWNRLSPTDE